MKGIKSLMDKFNKNKTYFYNVNINSSFVQIYYRLILISIIGILIFILITSKIHI